MITHNDLLERALKLACQIPELHEISYHMGQIGGDVVPEAQRGEYRRGQQIMSEATALVIEIENEMHMALASVAPPRAGQ